MPIPSSPPGIVTKAVLPYKVWRASGQSMTLSCFAPSTGNVLSITNKTRHYELFPFREYRAAVQTFYSVTVNNNLLDIPLLFGMNYQVGFDLQYQAAVTGLAQRPLLTFSGSPTATHAVFAGVTLAQNATAGTYANILGVWAPGQIMFAVVPGVGPVSMGILQSASGGNFVLQTPWPGAALATATCTTNNSAIPCAAAIYSDIYDIGQYYQPGSSLLSPNFFGLHTTQENTSQTIITGAVCTTGSNALTMTSISGPFGIGYPVYNTSGTLAGIVGGGSGLSWTFLATAAVSIATATAYCQALIYQRNASGFLQRFEGSNGTSTIATTTSATATASTTVTLAGTSSGWIKGQLFQATGLTTATPVYIVDFGTSTGGNGTIIVNQAITVAGVAATGIQSNIALNIASSTATYNASTVSPTGSGIRFTPCTLLMLTNSTLPFVSHIGDSIAYGSDEGSYGSTAATTSATSGVMTLGGANSGSALVAGETIWSASRVLLGTLGTNLTGASSGNAAGSTWNFTGANFASQTIYATISGTDGDTCGSALGNSGFIERGLREICGFPGFNASHGSDANLMLALGVNWAWRQQLLALANATHIPQMNIHNDIARLNATAAPAWTANTAVTQFTVVSGASALYDLICITPGITGQTAPAASTLGSYANDGTVVWQVLFPHITATNAEGATLCIGYMALVNAKINSISPGSNLMGLLPTMDAGSSDLFVTTANQTPTANGWGGTAVSGTASQTGGQAGTTTITIASGLNISQGSPINLVGFPAGLFVVSLGTYSAGAGTVIVSSAITVVGNVAFTGINSTRSNVYSMLTLPYVQKLVKWNSFLDLCALLESGGSGQSGKWIVNGVSYGRVYDGTHPSSSGYLIGSACVKPQSFAAI